MDVDRAEEASAEHKKPAAHPPTPTPSPSQSPWDCGSPLYDAFELASVHRVLDTHLMALPFPRRPCDGDDAVAVGVAKRATARSRRRRGRAAGVAKAATRTGKAVLRSIMCGSVACGRRRL